MTQFEDRKNSPAPVADKQNESLGSRMPGFDRDSLRQSLSSSTFQPKTTNDELEVTSVRKMDNIINSMKAGETVTYQGSPDFTLKKWPNGEGVTLEFKEGENVEKLRINRSGNIEDASLIHPNGDRSELDAGNEAWKGRALLARV